MTDHPFGPFSGFSGAGGNPLDDEGNIGGPKCPRCKSQNFRAWTTDYGIMRKCLENGCGEEWSGGSVAVSQNYVDYDFRPLADDAAAPDIDIPTVQFTGANYRDLSKNFGDDEW